MLRVVSCGASSRRPFLTVAAIASEVVVLPVVSLAVAVIV
jgi:hypothetical protein